MASQSNLFGQADDPGVFAESRIPPSDAERRVAAVIWQHQGRRKPVPLRTLCKTVAMSEREAKGVVERLRMDHGIKIGASRREPVGYFIIRDTEDVVLSLGPFKSQIFTMLRTFRRLATPAMYRELAGQIRLELGPEPDLSALHEGNVDYEAPGGDYG